MSPKLSKYAVRSIPHDVLKTAFKGGHANGFRILRQGKHTIIHPDLDAVESSGLRQFSIVSFPRDYDMPEFQVAVEGTRQLTPGNHNPGAVGSSLVNIGPDGSLELDASQAHYMTVGNPRLRKPECGLRRGLATKYQGWRRRNLKVVLDLARERRVHIKIPDSAFLRNVDNSKARFNQGLLDDLTEVCEEGGVKLQHFNRGRARGGPYYIIDPKVHSN